MKKFTVTWHPDAEEELAHIWITGIDRKRITLTVAAIDNTLATDPDVRGESVREGLRRLDIALMRVLFAVKPADRVVEVLMVALR
jgi:mRNA-degrading endonuclease RelE of RelBE toxin-antitoxin system